MTLLERVRSAPPEGLMSIAECERLAELAAEVPANQAIVEIGSYRGLSSAWLAAGAAAGNGARVTCIDLWPQPLPTERDQAHAERQRGALPAFLGVQESLRWPVTALRGRATDIAPMWLQPVGLLFHDAAHDYRSVADDLATWLPQLAPNAVIALHDYLGDQMERTDVARVVDDKLGDWNHSQVIDKLWVGWR